MVNTNTSGLKLAHWQESLSTLYVEVISILIILHERNNKTYAHKAHLKQANALNIGLFIEHATNAFKLLDEEFNISIYYRTQFNNILQKFIDLLESEELDELQVTQLMGESGGNSARLEAYEPLIKNAIENLEQMELTCIAMWKIADRLDEATLKEGLEGNPLGQLSKDELRDHVLSSEMTLHEMRYLNLVAGSLIHGVIVTASEAKVKDESSEISHEFTWNVKVNAHRNAERKRKIVINDYIAA